MSESPQAPYGAPRVPFDEWRFQTLAKILTDVAAPLNFQPAAQGLFARRTADYASAVRRPFQDLTLAEIIELAASAARDHAELLDADMAGRPPPLEHRQQ